MARSTTVPDRTRALHERGSAGLWFAVFGGATAWFVSLCASFFLVPWACEGRFAVLPLVSLAALLVSLAAGFAALRLWRGTGGGSPGEGVGPTPRTRLLSLVGLFLSGLFSMIVLLQLVATFVIPPCEPLPRNRLDPDASVEPAAPRLLAAAPWSVSVRSAP